MADINVQLKQAMTLIKQGDVIEAQRLLKTVLQANNNNADAWVLMAMSLSDADRKRKALENALRIDPNHKQGKAMLAQLTQGDDDDDIDPRLSQAVDYIQAGNLERAMRLASAVIQEDKTNVDAWWVMANSLEEDGKILSALRNVVRLNPDHQEARQWMVELEAARMTRFNEDKEPEWIAQFALAKEFNQVALDAADDGSNPFEDGASVGGNKKKRVSKAKSGNNLALAILGLLIILVIAGLGFFIIMQGRSNKDDFESFRTLPSTIQMGTIGFGQTVSGTLSDGFTDHSWTFFGEDGVRIILETNSSVDTAIRLFNSSGEQIAYADDIADDNVNALMDMTLPASGTYTVVVESWSTGGDYQLILR